MNKYKKLKKLGVIAGCVGTAVQAGLAITAAILEIKDGGEKPTLQNVAGNVIQGLIEESEE